MFDPHHLSYRNRRIQQQAQILRSKGTTFIPQKIYGPNDFKEMQKILIANKIQAYVPQPLPGPTGPIQIDSISVDRLESTIPFSDFMYTDTPLTLNRLNYFYINLNDNRIDIYYINNPEGHQQTIPANSYYLYGGAVMREFVFHSPTLGWFMSVDINTPDNSASLSFNSSSFQLIGLSGSS